MNKHPNKHLFSFATIAAIAGNNDKQLPKSFESLKLKAALQSAEKRLLWIGNAAFCVINRGGVPLRESGGLWAKGKKGDWSRCSFQGIRFFSNLTSNVRLLL